MVPISFRIGKERLLLKRRLRSNNYCPFPIRFRLVFRVQRSPTPQPPLPPSTPKTSSLTTISRVRALVLPVPILKAREGALLTSLVAWVLNPALAPDGAPQSPPPP